MADVYCDMSLGTGLNDGTSWANAYQALATALDGANTVGGDILWLKGSESLAATQVLFGEAIEDENPVIVLGCKSATTNEPPTQSDLIPGWRTGEARTAANRAHEDGDIPTLTTTGTNDIAFRDSLYIYGVAFVSGDDLFFPISNSLDALFEECLLQAGDFFFQNEDAATARVRTVNCKWQADTILNYAGYQEHIGLTAAADPSSALVDSANGVLRFYGCDLSLVSTLVDLAGTGDHNKRVIIANSELKTGWATTSGTQNSAYRVELHQCSDVSSKSSGTILNLEIETQAGSIVEETTAVRTDGANDGSSDWAMAFTPAANGTRDQYYGLISDWMHFEVLSTDTQVDVHIANSGAGDYQDDEVWMELLIPSEDGTAQFTFLTTQADLLGTPANITDDTGSTWGTGASNHQILRQAIAPDYDGLAYYRIVNAKNFSSSPETLYVDPLPVVT